MATVYDKSAQIRRGLARGLDFFTANELARQAAERDAAQMAAKTQAQQSAAVDKQRFQTALDLAKLGNVGAQGALQSYVQRGDPSALADIGAFDEEAARNYQLAKEFGLPLTKEEQFGPANELLKRLGIQTQVGTTPTQKSRIGSFDALTSLRETQAKNDEAIAANRVLHLKALTNAANARTREIQQRVSKGKMTDADIGDHLNELQDTEAILADQLKALSSVPDFWENPDDPPQDRKVNKRYLPALQELTGAHDRVRNMVTTYTNFMANRAQQFQPPARPLAPGQVPSRIMPPYQQTAPDFVRQLMQSRIGQQAPPISQVPAAPPPTTMVQPQAPSTQAQLDLNSINNRSQQIYNALISSGIPEADARQQTITQIAAENPALLQYLEETPAEQPAAAPPPEKPSAITKTLQQLFPGSLGERITGTAPAPKVEKTPANVITPEGKKTLESTRRYFGFYTKDEREQAKAAYNQLLAQKPAKRPDAEHRKIVLKELENRFGSGIVHELGLKR